VNDYRIFYVGTEHEVGHQAAPLAKYVSVEVAEPEVVERSARSGDLAIFFSEHFHRFRNTWYQLHSRGCLTLYAIDGILEWRNAWENSVDEPACPWTMRPVLSDKVACTGVAQAAILDGWGNSGKTEVVGLPRLDAAIEASRSKNGHAADSSRLNVLVATAKWPGYTPGQRAQIRESLSDLHTFSLNHPVVGGRAVQWTWRLTAGLAAGIGVPNTLTDTTGRELAEVLDSMDAVITTPSTVMLESMIRGIPTAILDYTNSPEYVPAAWRINARSQIGDVVSQLAWPAASRMHYQQFLLQQALQTEISASVRMAELCRQMIRIAHDCRANGLPVVFPSPILPPLSRSPNFESLRFWPEDEGGAPKAGSAAFDALARENQRQLQVLQRRVALLESELSRAAEGFEKIATHPILGPLLKVRQTAIRFGNQIGQVLSRETSGSADELTKGAATERERPAQPGVRPAKEQQGKNRSA
jgi:hypothetical protein